MFTMILPRNEFIRGIEFKHGSIVKYFDNGQIVVCSHFFVQKNKLELFLFNGAKWVRTYAPAIDGTAKEIIKLHRKQNRNNNLVKCANLMKHERKHKKAGGGSCSRFSGIVTDYECAKEPLHDFRRTRIMIENTCKGWKKK